MEKTKKIKLPKPKKGQKCWGCKKEIKRDFCWECLEKKKNWKQQFKEEFGIHFKGSKGELQFAIAFIEDLLKEKNKEDFDKKNKELFEEYECDHHWVFYPYYNSSLAQSGCWKCDKCGKIKFPENTSTSYSSYSCIVWRK